MESPLSTSSSVISLVGNLFRGLRGSSCDSPTNAQLESLQNLVEGLRSHAGPLSKLEFTKLRDAVRDLQKKACLNLTQSGKGLEGRFSTEDIAFSYREEKRLISCRLLISRLNQDASRLNSLSLVQEREIISSGNEVSLTDISKPPTQSHTASKFNGRQEKRSMGASLTPGNTISLNHTNIHVVSSITIKPSAEENENIHLKISVPSGKEETPPLTKAATPISDDTMERLRELESMGNPINITNSHGELIGKVILSDSKVSITNLCHHCLDVSFTIKKNGRAHRR